MAVAQALPRRSPILSRGVKSILISAFGVHSTRANKGRALCPRRRAMQQEETFTLDYGQMNKLLDLLNPLFHDSSGKEIEDAGKWEQLRSFRNQLHRYLD